MCWISKRIILDLNRCKQLLRCGYNLGQLKMAWVMSRIVGMLKNIQFHESLYEFKRSMMWPNQ